LSDVPSERCEHLAPARQRDWRQNNAETSYGIEPNPEQAGRAAADQTEFLLDTTKRLQQQVRISAGYSRLFAEIEGVGQSNQSIGGI